MITLKYWTRPQLRDRLGKVISSSTPIRDCTTSYPGHLCDLKKPYKLAIHENFNLTVNNAFIVSGVHSAVKL